MAKTLPALEVLTQQKPLWTSPKSDNPNPEGTNQYNDILDVAIYTSKAARARLQAK